MENKPIGFVGQTSVHMLPKESVLKLFTATSEPEKTNISRFTKADSAEISTKTNSAVKSGTVNIFGASVKFTDKTNLANIKNEIPDFKMDDQGDTNSCGTTSLASVLKHFGLNVKDHWEIDKSVRSTRFDMFTAPSGVVSYAKSKGMNAGMKNNSNPEEVASFIDKGVPVMVLIDVSPETKTDTALHWEVVTGYERNNKGEIDKLKLANPSGGYSHTDSIEDFKEEWGKIKIGMENTPVIGGDRVIDTGYNNLIVPMVPKNKTIKAPDGRTINTKDIKIPNQFDTYQGYAAQIFGKGAVLVDRTISAGEYIQGKVTYLAKKIGL